jgi:hypothetical protein
MEEIMATQKREGKVVTVYGMSVAGGDLKLPNGMKYFVNMELDYTDVTFEDAIELASGGSSVRVQAQAKLRLDESTLKRCGVVAEAYTEDVKSDLADAEFVIFNVATDFESEKGGKRDPAKTAASAFSKMDREQKVNFIIQTMQIDRAVAEAMVK